MGARGAIEGAERAADGGGGTEAPRGMIGADPDRGGGDEAPGPGASLMRLVIGAALEGAALTGPAPCRPVSCARASAMSGGSAAIVTSSSRFVMPGGIPAGASTRALTAPTGLMPAAGVFAAGATPCIVIACLRTGPGPPGLGIRDARSEPDGSRVPSCTWEVFRSFRSTAAPMTKL